MVSWANTKYGAHELNLHERVHDQGTHINANGGTSMVSSLVPTGTVAAVQTRDTRRA